MLTIDRTLERTTQNEVICWTVAAALHALMFAWNPILLKSDFKKIADFVNVDIVEETGAPLMPEAPKKMSMMDTLKDMLLTPKAEQLAKTSPEPVRPVAAPQLVEKNRPKPMAFTPQTQEEELAALKSPQQIAPGQKLPDVKVGGPTLEAKKFGGIRPKDLPFNVSSNESINTADSSNIPIAVGHTASKDALAYSGPTLKQSSNRRMGITPGLSGTNAPSDTVAMSAPAQIAVGTGGTGSIPTGEKTGATLQQKSGGLVSRGLVGGRGGSGISGLESMPGDARALDSQLSQGEGASKSAKRKGFDISGPLMNRGISFKVIPEYPAWAEEQGIMGSVRLYFTVDAAGNVRSNIRVTKTTGYPALDQLGIDALKKWKFVPLAGGSDEGQWGIITFNFSLAS